MLLNWIFHSFVRTSCYRFDTCSATYLTADLTTTDTAGFLATVDVTIDLATTHVVADLVSDELATIKVDIYPYTDDYLDTYLVADLVTDLAAALATTDLIREFATIDLATLQRLHHWRRSRHAINMPPMMSAVARSAVTSMVVRLVATSCRNGCRHGLSLIHI